ncbi:MAG: hypothetical protein PSX37_09535, partial [bacterium]|nr:hypothetical protein [bacterium]
VTSISGNVGAALPSPAPPATPVPAVTPAPAPAPVANVMQRRVSLLTPTAITTKHGHRYKVVGIVRPAKAGLKTWRQVLVDGVWTTVEKTKTNAKGRYKFVVKKTGKAGTKTFRVLIVKKKTVAGVSAEFTVTVLPKR